MIVPVLLAAAIPLERPARGADAPVPVAPRIYELQIDGESVLIEANRSVELKSKRKPGVAYQVAIRVAPVQRLKLENLQLEYDMHSKVESTRRPGQQSVKIQHQLGFTMLVNDLGPPIAEEGRDEALKILTESAVETYRDTGIKQADIKITRLVKHQFGGAEGRGVRIDYPDAQGIRHSVLVYVLVGKTFSASCIAQFLDRDGDDVLPLVRKTMDSVRGLGKAPGGNGGETPTGDG
jgi:hypothetical protein